MKNSFFILTAVLTACFAVFAPEVSLASGAILAGSIGLPHYAWKQSVKQELIKKYTVGGQSPIIQDSFLRIEQVLTTGQSNYAFNLTKGSTDLLVEQKLDVNDVFVITEFGWFVYEATVAKRGIEVLNTHVSLAGFPNVTAGNVPDLELAYNGILTIAVGTTTYVPSWDLKRHRYVPISQKGATTAAIAGPTTYTLERSDFNGAMDGWVPLSQTIKLNGQATNNVSAILPVYGGAVLTHNSASYENRVVFYPRGFVIKNVAKREGQEPIHHGGTSHHMGK